MNHEKLRGKKVVLVHDWLYGGGAEKVVEQFHALFPDAPIYTSYCSDEWRKRLDGKVVTGYLQRWPFSKLRRFLPLLRMWWFRSLNLSDYDVILSSSGTGEAKHVRKKRGQTHINYCHTPPHFLWKKYDEYMKHPGFGALDPVVRIGLKLLLKPLRKADYKAAQNINAFMANSTHIAEDIKTYYKRQASVVFPPVDIERFSNDGSQSRDGFVIFGRHVRHKRFDLAIAACNELQKRLVVIGTGPETAQLKAAAGSTIEFKGRVSDDDLFGFVSRAEGFLFCNEEDFGIVAVEAQAAGTPVIAYRAGGALDIVQENVTGEFFDKQTVQSMTSVLKRFNHKLYNRHDLRESAERFTPEVFRDNILKFVVKNV